MDTDPTFRLVGTPKSLFTGPYELWDISPDGKRFFMIKEPGTTGGISAAEGSEAEGPNKINIVLNWFEELKEKVPVD